MPVPRGIICAGGGKHEDANNHCSGGTAIFHDCTTAVRRCKGRNGGSGDHRHDV